MIHFDSGKNSLSKLRKKAEKKLKPFKKKSVKGALPEAEHELNVHKIELEMQNEELLSTQAKLYISIKEYSELFEFAPVGYFILNKYGVILNVNQTGSEQLGFSKKKLTGKHLSIFLISKSYQDSFYRHRDLVTESGKQQQLECEIKKSDGSAFFALIESSVIKDEKNNFKHFITTISDITLQKERALWLESALLKEKELNEMKSQFLTIASHEFRTPLTAILSSSELLGKYNRPEDEDKRKKHLYKIKTSVNRLKEILMDFSSANDAEKEESINNPESFALDKFLVDLIEEVKAFNGIHRVKYKHTGKLQNVILDKKLLKTCISNLIINAYKYSPKGGTIEIESKPNSSGGISITIKDEGMGIPESDKPHIFEQFYRAKNASDFQGTGLGLYITQKFITLMGGSISFTSKEKEGTTFIIDLPIR